MSTLIIVEYTNHVMHPGTLAMVNAALQRGEKPTLAVIGYQCESVAHEAATIEGVEKVLWIDEPCYEHQLSENVSELVVHLASNYSAILVQASTFGKDLLPRVAAKLNVGQVSDVTRFVDTTTVEHPIYAGNAIETVEICDPLQLMTIRTTAFSPVANSQSACDIERLHETYETQQTRFIRRELSQFERPELSKAKIVVSGGRGLQNAEKFKLIEELADVLGAAVGASRAAVDAGFVPNDYQIGQTGKIIAPLLYIAVGISGAVQHLAGMREAKVIVAINKDEDAPIFQVATYGLVGDLFELVPQMIQQLQTS